MAPPLATVELGGSVVMLEISGVFEVPVFPLASSVVTLEISGICEELAPEPPLSPEPAVGEGEGDGEGAEPAPATPIQTPGRLPQLWPA